MEEPQTPPDAPEEPTAPTEDPATKRKRAVIGLAAAIVIGAAATGIAYYAENHTGWVAKVDGARISKPEYERLLEATKSQYQARFNVDFASAQGQSMLTDLKSGLMGQLVERELIRQEAAKRHIQVGDAEVDAKLAELKKGMSDAELTDKLKANGLDMVGFRSQVRDQLEVERVVQDVTRETAAVPDTEVRKYYDEHKSLYDKQQEVRARHVLVKDEATAKMLQGKLKGGADFAGLAKEYSEDPGSKDSGGDLGYFQRGRMVKEFEEAAFKTPVGQVTPIVKTQFGFHILKVEDKREPRLQPFKEVEAEIRENMGAERRRTAFGAWLEQRKQAAKLEFQPGYKPVPKPAGDPGEDGGHGHGPGDGHGH